MLRKGAQHEVLHLVLNSLTGGGPAVLIVCGLVVCRLLLHEEEEAHHMARIFLSTAIQHFYDVTTLSSIHPEGYIQRRNVCHRPRDLIFALAGYSRDTRVDEAEVALEGFVLPVW